MIEAAINLVPPDVPAWGAAAMLAAAAIGGFVTAAFGIGGGIMLLAVMTVFLPVPAAIPLHGVVQIGSNAGRTALLYRAIRWPVLAAFAAGGLIGAAAGSRILVAVPAAWIELALGLFILASCWLPTPAPARGSLVRVGIGGGVTSLLTLFLGATGPFVATLVRASRLDRRVHMATFSACMTLQHGLKLAVFGLAGFAFGPYLPWLAAMLACVLAGTWLGRQVLERVHERLFRRGLTLLLTLIALHLIVRALLDPAVLPAGS